MDQRATRITLKPDPLTDWYGAWLAQHGARARREAADKAQMAREIRLMTGLLVGWTVVSAAGGIAALALWARF